jgi:hypothetical protein
MVALVCNKQHGISVAKIAQDMPCKAVSGGVDYINHIFSAQLFAFPAIKTYFRSFCPKMALYLVFPLGSQECLRDNDFYAKPPVGHYSQMLDRSERQNSFPGACDRVDNAPVTIPGPQV